MISTSHRLDWQKHRKLCQWFDHLICPKKIEKPHQKNRTQFQVMENSAIFVSLIAFSYLMIKRNDKIFNIQCQSFYVFCFYFWFTDISYPIQIVYDRCTLECTHLHVKMYVFIRSKQNEMIFSCCCCLMQFICFNHWCNEYMNLIITTEQCNCVLLNDFPNSPTQIELKCITQRVSAIPYYICQNRFL